MFSNNKFCKTCNKCGHSRTSSKKCHYYEPPLKYRINQIEYETESLTVKCGLNKFAKRNHILISKITEDVLEISSLMIESSILFNYYYYKLCQSESNLVNQKPSVLDFFYQLKGTRTLEEEYRQLRPDANKLYNGRHRSYLIQNATKTFETNIKNNIIVHMYSRVKRYFKLKFANIDKKFLNEI